MNKNNKTITRRQFLHFAGAFGLMAGYAGIAPAYAFRQSRNINDQRPEILKEINLSVRRKSMDIGGKEGKGITINGSIPGPIVRLKEGENAVIHVTNELDQDTSIHWHGIILPNNMDGVPGVTFSGIKPGETFTYRYPVNQNGTYW